MKTNICSIYFFPNGGKITRYYDIKSSFKEYISKKTKEWKKKGYQIKKNVYKTEYDYAPDPYLKHDYLCYKNNRLVFAIIYHEKLR